MILRDYRNLPGNFVSVVQFGTASRKKSRLSSRRQQSSIEVFKKQDTMIENKKRKRKVFMSEDDISMILRRYSTTTLLALLQEVAQSPGVKVDWNVLVKKTSTGISNAREYQMLWRHLAYRHALLEKIEDGAGPLDDDSDLEVELEPFPVVNGEASTEAAACVKVLIASGLPSECCPPNRATVEAPLTINIPNDHSSCNPSHNPQQAPSAQGTNITIPVSVQKQPLPSVPSSEVLEGNGSASGNLPPRRKRKLWTHEEDMELIAAVQKCGEGNWANILKGDFSHDRSASQLSQRWAIIRKRKASLISTAAGNSTGGALTEAQLAARQAVSMALNMPMKGSSLATSSSAAGNHLSIDGNSSTAPAATGDATLVCAPPPEASTKALVTSSQQMLQQPQAGNQVPLPKVASSSDLAPPKSRPAAKRHSAPAKSLPTGPNPLIQAAAVAAGARIANPSTAASLFKAAQSRNAVHIPQGGSVPQSAMPGARSLGINTIGSLPPNVHYIQSSLTSLAPTYPGMMPSGPRLSNVQVGSGRLSAMGQPPMGSTTLLNQQVVPECKSSLACGNSNSKKSCVSTTVPVGFSAASEDKHAEEKKLDSTGEVLKESVRDQASLTNLKAGGEHNVVDGACETQHPVVRQTDAAANICPDENLMDVDEPVDPLNSEAGKEHILGNGSTCENQSEIEEMASSPNMELHVDQTVINKADENQDMQKVLPISDVDENLSSVNAGGHENQDGLDKQTGSTKVGEKQTVHDSTAVVKHEDAPNIASG